MMAAMGDSYDDWDDEIDDALLLQASQMVEATATQQATAAGDTSTALDTLGREELAEMTRMLDDDVDEWDGPVPGPTSVSAPRGEIFKKLEPAAAPSKAKAEADTWAKKPLRPAPT